MFRKIWNRLFGQAISATETPREELPPELLAADLSSPEAWVALQDQLAAAANRLMITVEKYPDLQGTRAFSDLQSQLEGTERRIKVARKDFNVAIAAYNSSVKSFPTSLVAGIFGFPAREGFEAVAGAENAVEIKF